MGKAKKSRERPYKLPVLEYIKLKGKRLRYWISDWFWDSTLLLKVKLLGYWYCRHHKTYHGPRTVKYRYDIEWPRGTIPGAIHSCSIGKNDLILNSNYRESDFNAYVGRTRL